MKTRGSMFQIKQEDKTSDKDLNEMEISLLPDTEFQIMVIRMFTTLWNTVKIRQRDRKAKIPNISQKAKEYNN